MAAMVFAVAAVLLALVNVASATFTLSLPAPGCTAPMCESAIDFNNYNFDGLVFNPALTADDCLVGAQPYVTGLTSPNQCCSACAATNFCGYWHFFPPPIQKHNCGSGGGASGRKLLQNAYTGVTGYCYLLQLNSSCVPAIDSAANQCKGSIFGGECNPYCQDDPHLQGAHGTPYDFNGALNKNFCLVSDKDFHVNMFLGGYLDANSTGHDFGAQVDGKAIRSWAKELGVIYKKDGQEHKVRLVARKGKEQTRGNGFLAVVEVDGKAAVIPAVGASTQLPAGAVFSFIGYEKKGPYDLDHFTLAIPEMLTMDIRMRVANPKLQTKDDAEVHFNMGFTSLKVSPQVHGVLGQTYRADRERVDRAVKYSALAKLLGHNVQVDGESGQGFLDGESADYISSSVLSTDCKFSQYESEKIIALPSTT